MNASACDLPGLCAALCGHAAFSMSVMADFMNSKMLPTETVEGTIRLGEAEEDQGGALVIVDVNIAIRLSGS